MHGGSLKSVKRNMGKEEKRKNSWKELIEKADEWGRSWEKWFETGAVDGERIIQEHDALLDARSGQQKQLEIRDSVGLEEKFRGDIITGIQNEHVVWIEKSVETFRVRWETWRKIWERRLKNRHRIKRETSWKLPEKNDVFLSLYGIFNVSYSATLWVISSQCSRSERSTSSQEIVQEKKKKKKKRMVIQK